MGANAFVASGEHEHKEDINNIMRFEEKLCL